ncbi:MAG: UDP-glucose 4-epimerase GalE [Lachnospirales bacterium]
MNILVCGGAGYIGSHTVLELLDKGFNVVVVDNLKTGHKASVSKNAKLYIGDLRDKDFLREVFKENEIHGVIDFAAYSLVGESAINPSKYFDNNIHGTQCLLDVMREFNVNYIVFSSTAATYGEPDSIPILETDKTEPTNPYGESKLCVEKILKWYDDAYGMKYVVLRYFNVAGAHISGEIGEAHTIETHLIPLVLQVPLGKRDAISIFGDDYDTHDGTCIRDYIHVTDLANAHILAINKIFKDNTSETYNLGNGKGFTVKEIIETSEKVVGKDINKKIVPRRKGDPARLVASSEKIMKELDWKPEYNSLEKIIETAWSWHKNNPNGFEK